MTIEQPLLAETAEESDFPNIRYPVIGSPKLDGIRCLKVNGKMVSRNFKEIPNKYIAWHLADLVPEGFDGELLLRSITRAPRTNPKKNPEGFQKEVAEIAHFNKIAKDKPHLIPFNYVSSEVMRFEGEPDYVYYVFDYVMDPMQPYKERIEALVESVGDQTGFGPPKIVVVPTFLINNEEELSLAEQKCVDDGFEGLMIRDPNGEYYTPRYLIKKALGRRADNRSNSEEGILLKIKRFEDGEAEIIGFQQKRSNQNEKEINVFGYSERSSKQEGIVLVDTLGALIVRDIKTGVEFKIGALEDWERDYFWQNQEKELGQIVKYKSQPAGKKDKPRFPTYQGKRHPNDMS